jgi:hypothetical protein
MRTKSGFRELVKFRAGKSLSLGTGFLADSFPMESSGQGDRPKGMIRHRETGQYYKGAGKWTSEANEAVQFDNLSMVVSETKKHRLEGCCEFVVELHGEIGFRALLSL